MHEDAVQRFVDAWGAMGAVWGVNRSVARVHALLMASDGPVSLDDIAERLAISKGNASMCLRELRTFGVVREAPRPGDRRDWYVTEPDVWTMAFRIVAERKKRELDPAVAAVRAAIEESDGTGPAHERLEQIADFLGTLEAIARRLVDNPTAARAAIAFLSAGAARPRKAKRRR
jgi:HTH-type transcriptional regulator, glycine betaine synthesis regulator